MVLPGSTCKVMALPFKDLMKICMPGIHVLKPPGVPGGAPALLATASEFAMIAYSSLNTFRLDWTLRAPFLSLFKFKPELQNRKRNSSLTKMRWINETKPLVVKKLGSFVCRRLLQQQHPSQEEWRHISCTFTCNASKKALARNDLRPKCHRPK